MDFKETQSSVDGKQANYDNEVVVVFEVGHLLSVFPTFAAPYFASPAAFMWVRRPWMYASQLYVVMPLC